MTIQDRGDLHDEAFRAAMRQLASGVSLITCRGADGMPRGMLATAVISATADPPTILACINRSASMYGDLMAAGTFCVNFLGQRHRELADRFSQREGRERRFEADGWTGLATGAPVLETALAALDCVAENGLEAGSHTVLLGRVEAVRLGPPEGRPLVYFDRRYGGWTGL